MYQGKVQVFYISVAWTAQSIHLDPEYQSLKFLAIPRSYRHHLEDFGPGPSSMYLLFLLQLLVFRFPISTLLYLPPRQTYEIWQILFTFKALCPSFLPLSLSQLPPFLVLFEINRGNLDLSFPSLYQLAFKLSTSSLQHTVVAVMTSQDRISFSSLSSTDRYFQPSYQPFEPYDLRS